ncbi:MAG TPA: DUF2167 domain-containing protein [Vicinamibacterales bacterium]|nr:DUF2167 domain-containing protein [Vicinamibacterales bacterium]
MFRTFAAAALAVALATATIAAQDSLTPEEFESKLAYKTGTVQISGGMATIKLPDSFRYLDEQDSRKVLVAWGNPPEAASDVLGMLVPSATSPLSEDGWAIVITYDDDGYVSDEDAKTLNFDKILSEMQEQTTETNKLREKEGFEPVMLVGWAEPPHYDAASHKLYWAKELKFGESKDHTLNYAIRILGRRGVLQLNAVSSIGQLAAVKDGTPDVLAAVEFNEGHRYADYLPGTDKAAAYGIGGLILGSAAAKAGLFKGIWLVLLASKKLVFGGLVALGALVKKFLGGNKDAAAQA